MKETWIWSLGQEDPLGEEMATHSSLLAWRISWTGEPGGFQSMGSQRVRHDWATEHHHLLLHLHECACMLSCSVVSICDCMDYGPPGSSVHGILQERRLEWIAISSPRGSSWPRDQAHVSCIGRAILYHWSIWEAPLHLHVPPLTFLAPLTGSLLKNKLREFQTQVWGSSGVNLAYTSLLSLFSNRTSMCFRALIFETYVGD